MKHSGKESTLKRIPKNLPFLPQMPEGGAQIIIVKYLQVTGASGVLGIKSIPVRAL